MLFATWRWARHAQDFTVSDLGCQVLAGAVSTVLMSTTKIKTQGSGVRNSSGRAERSRTEWTRVVVHVRRPGGSALSRSNPKSSLLA
eukprot:CAMPEP_0175994260 /NCGR_PEP_ID=MMETSP0108-20121206/54471_1 /TAXON_ID=195067 ORGANISM="Goniomonas pacifica, Strain CCMP1869" /NCGR_SAMPLE_ID=MMETSP0108 /ASSEMBLY_ACC=CAM_ASM_000204 /LENGTH=86 /DNA_ID=CAMNT_0017326239 /DNA_START=243 /DNA_END=503 /DNA_ORIENTATION=+